MKKFIIPIYVFLFSISRFVLADDVKIVEADFRQISSNKWSVNVTLEHGDTGWNHYADNWRVVDKEGNILGNRVLHHPHVGGQPFTRGLGSVNIVEDTKVVYIEAHDKKHGWASNRLMVDMTKVVRGRLRVQP
jgi:hypothetical protein